ncbi:unnamed protein product, partial [Porites lobata]
MNVMGRVITVLIMMFAMLIKAKQDRNLQDYADNIMQKKEEITKEQETAKKIIDGFAKGIEVSCAARTSAPEYGVTVVSKDTNPKKLRETPCRPRPAAIKVPKDPEYLNRPSFITLHRCSGGCPTKQNYHHCTVRAKTQILVNVWKIGSSLRRTNVTMYNHTHCSCDCIKSSSDCHPDKQEWIVDSCSCKCRSDLSACAPNQ